MEEKNMLTDNDLEQVSGGEGPSFLGVYDHYKFGDKKLRCKHCGGDFDLDKFTLTPLSPYPGYTLVCCSKCGYAGFIKGKRNEIADSIGIHL